MLLLVGCGLDQKIEGSYIQLNKDGSVEATIVELFDKDYYKVDELVAMTNQEIAAYNGAITLKEYELDGINMKMVFTFNDVDTYNSYMPYKLYVGTVQEAYNAGYSIDRILRSTSSKGETIDRDNLLNMASSKVIIVDGAIALKTPTNITYYENSATLINKTLVNPNGGNEYFIMYK